MAHLEIRMATMDDTAAISALFRAQIHRWQRMTADGQVEDLPYEALTIYERWLHGDGYSNPWMSLETAAIFLSHLLRGAGVPLVMWEDDTLVAYAQCYISQEQPPFGHHLHLAHFISATSQNEARLMDALMEYLPQLGMNYHCTHYTVSCPSFDEERATLYQRYGMEHAFSVRGYTLPAQTGQSFYKAVEHRPAEAAQIADWQMVVGRSQSARQHWETLWPSLWEAFPEIIACQTHRLKMSASGQDAFVCYQQRLFLPRYVDVYCWSPKPLTSQLLVALRDWAHRAGYRTLNMVLPDNSARLLPADNVEAEPHETHIYMAALT